MDPISIAKSIILPTSLSVRGLMQITMEIVAQYKTTDVETIQKTLLALINRAEKENTVTTAAAASLRIFVNDILPDMVEIVIVNTKDIAHKQIFSCYNWFSDFICRSARAIPIVANNSAVADALEKIDNELDKVVVKSISPLAAKSSAPLPIVAEDPEKEDVTPKPETPKLGDEKVSL